MIVNGKNIDETEEMVQYRGVPHYSKTGKSYHELNDLAGYAGFAVVVYDKTGKSCHDLGKLAGYAGFAVVVNNKTGKSYRG